VDLNLPGMNRLAVFLAKNLIPKYEKEAFILETIHGIQLLINPSEDIGIEENLYRFGTYEKGILNFIEKNLKQDQVFLDVGANIGLMSCFASKVLRESGKVLAVEANPKTREILHYNLKLNSCNNVSVFPLGLGNEQGKALFFENWEVNRGGASFLNQSSSENQGIEVEISTIDKLFEDQPIDIIKIDVEGFELNVLQGGIASIEKHKPILIIEVSSNREHEIGVKPQEIRTFIMNLGFYKIYKLAGSKERISKLVEVKSEQDLPEDDNIICLPF
jgi:FkbM family methyltransferase